MSKYKELRANSEERMTNSGERRAFIRFAEFTWFTRFSRFALLELNELSKPSKLSKLFTLFFLLFFAGGCATSTSTQYIRKNVDYKNLRRIAVLPFESLTTDEYAGEKIRKSVITELLSRGVDVIEPGEVTRVLIDQKIKSLSSVRTTDLQNMAKTLGVEALMMGSVEAYDISRGISVTYPEVSINLRLIEASSGNIIWSVCQTSGGPGFWTRHFGAEGMSLSETANEVVNEAIDTLF
jgi:TolB-like protein